MSWSTELRRGIDEKALTEFRDRGQGAWQEGRSKEQSGLSRSPTVVQWATLPRDSAPSNIDLWRTSKKRRLIFATISSKLRPTKKSSEDIFENHFQLLEHLTSKN